MTGEGPVDVEGLAAGIMSRLEAAANPERAGKGASYTPTAARIIGVAVPDVRRAARDAVRELKGAPPDAVLGLARSLIETVSYMLSLSTISPDATFLTISKTTSEGRCRMSWPFDLRRSLVLTQMDWSRIASK